MADSNLRDSDVLREIFELPMEWVKALYSMEYCLTKHSTDDERNDEKRLYKEKWLDRWEDNVTQHFRDLTHDEEYSLICDDIALQEYIRVLSQNATQKSYSYLIIIESLFFRPFYEFEVNDPGSSDQAVSMNQSSLRLRYKLDIEYLKMFTRAMNIDDEILDTFKQRFRKAYMAISGQNKFIAIAAIVSGIAIAVTAGLASPAVAVLAAGPGLYGAAAISHGLAVIGGGAIAIGGYGMAGGIAVLVASGGILGIVGGAGVGLMLSSSPKMAVFLASKLEVFFREVLINILEDKQSAEEVLNGQSAFIDSINKLLNERLANPNPDRKKIKHIIKVLEYLIRGLARNRKYLMDH